MVALAACALLAGAPGAYGLSGAASSGHGPAASAQYPNSGVSDEPVSVNPSSQHGSQPASGVQQGAASGSGSLPFTGLTIAGVALLGVTTLAAGLWLRRPRREDEPTAS